MSSISSFSGLNLHVPLTDEQIKANKDIDAKQQLQQDDFFALLSQQLAYQDPFKPVDNSEMIAQMASFTTAEGISTMGAEFGAMTEVLNSSKALEASTLVGKKVLIPSNTGYLGEEDNLTGSVTTKSGAYNVMVRVENELGVVVRSLPLGDLGAGNHRISWDGLSQNGDRLPNGKYSFNTTGMVNGRGEELTTASYAHVQSVSLGGGNAGVNLNLKGLGGIRLADAIEVSEK
ncbi:MAG: flagellar hook assembly protein FlgD [Psychromonas sp.]|nr:flagellar hook assembly protein FlgD [Psychromonas sp.]